LQIENYVIKIICNGTCWQWLYIGSNKINIRSWNLFKYDDNHFKETEQLVESREDITWPGIIYLGEKHEIEIERDSDSRIRNVIFRI